MNMEGAGSLRLANWLYNAAPKDGTVIGTTSRAAPFAALIGTQGGTNFDPAKFNWIGSANNEVSTCVAWHSAPVKSFGQLRNTTLVIGGDGPGADGEQFARVMNALFDTRIKIVSGYPGGNAINLAVERGEVDGRCGWSWSGIVAERRHWIDEAQDQCARAIRPAEAPRPAGRARWSSISPRATSSGRSCNLCWRASRSDARTSRHRACRLIAPRRCAQAFMATMNDPQFQAAAQKSKLEINPMSGAEVAGLINGIVTGVSSSAVARTKEILSRN